MVDVDTALFEEIFSAEGVSELAWEEASECGCYSQDSHQPEVTCPLCGGTGVTYAPAKIIRALFRDQSRYLSFRAQGEYAHGDATLTTPLSVKPGYISRRVRDRFTVVVATGDTPEGRVFFPAAQAAPFLFTNIQRAWRVSLQAADETDRLIRANS